MTGPGNCVVGSVALFNGICYLAIESAERKGSEFGRSRRNGGVHGDTPPLDIITPCLHRRNHYSCTLVLPLMVIKSLSP